MIEQINKLRRQGKAMAAKNLGNALRMSGRFEHLTHVVHGENDEFWIVGPVMADRLERAGYEIIGRYGAAIH